MEQIIKAAAVIPAAGSGRRMAASVNKVWLSLNGDPVLTHTLRSFQASDFISHIVLVVNEDELDKFDSFITSHRDEYRIPVSLVLGGKERQDSVANGLDFLYRTEGVKPELVAIHDAARALITPNLIETVIRVGKEYRAVGMAVPVKDTIKQADSERFITHTPDRALLWAMQTPQVFDLQLIWDCYQKVASLNRIFSDDCAVVEYCGHRVKLVTGSYDNFKLTTPEDMLFAEAVLRAREERANANRARV